MAPIKYYSSHFLFSFRNVPCEDIINRDLESLRPCERQNKSIVKLIDDAFFMLTLGVFRCQQDVQIAVIVGMPQRVQDRANFLLLNLARFARVKHRKGSAQHLKLF